MRLNTMKPASGAKKNRRRVGRGIGSGLGKTAGRGHKGQSSRSGGFHKVGFEGGQMPLQRRLPKRGFVSLAKNDHAEIRLSDLQKLPLVDIDVLALRAAGLVPGVAKTVKVIKTGKIEKAVTLTGILATAGAKAAIEAAGGSVAGVPPRKVKEVEQKAWQKKAAEQKAEPKAEPKGEKKAAKTEKAEKQPKAEQKSDGKK